MTTTFVTTDMTNVFTIAAEGDLLDVMPSGVITASNLLGAVVGAFGCEIEVLGAIAGVFAGINVGVAGQSSYIYVGASGSVSGSSSEAGVETAGSFYLENHGDIFGSGGSSSLGSGVIGTGAGTIVNYGSISGITKGINAHDNATGDLWTLDNYGAIYGADYSFDGLSETDTIMNSGSMNGDVQLGAGNGGSIDNTGTISGNIAAPNGETVTNSGVITGVVTLSDGTVNLDNATMTLSGSGDKVTIGAGADNDLTVGGNGVSGSADVVNGSNAIVNVSVNSNVQVNGDADTVAVGANANVVVSGSDETLYLSNGSVANLVSPSDDWSGVFGSGGTVELNNEKAAVFGSGDSIDLASGPSNVAALFNSDGNWDGVYGSNGVIELNSVKTAVYGFDDAIDLVSGTGNVAAIYNSVGFFDGVYGSDGVVELNSVKAVVTGGGDTVYFASGSGNVAALFGSIGNADAVSGSNGIVELNGVSSAISGSSNVVYFNNGNDTASLTGASDTIVAAQGIGGMDTISGFASTDTLQFSAQNFANYQALSQSGDLSEIGGNTVVTLTASDSITVVGATLSASQFVFA